MGTGKNNTAQSEGGFSWTVIFVGALTEASDWRLLLRLFPKRTTCSSSRDFGRAWRRGEAQFFGDTALPSLPLTWQLARDTPLAGTLPQGLCLWEGNPPQACGHKHLLKVDSDSGMVKPKEDSNSGTVNMCPTGKGTYPFRDRSMPMESKICKQLSREQIRMLGIDCSAR